MLGWIVVGLLGECVINTAGAAITSSASADKNSLQTASLTYSDLANRQDTRASSMSISVGNDASALANAGRKLVGNLAGQAGLPKSGSQSSQASSVISPANITLTGTGDAAKDKASATAVSTLTSRDASAANQSLKNTLTLQDAAKVQDKLKTAQQNQQAANLVGAVVDNVIGDVVQKNGWAEGSTQKMLLHGLSGLVQASIAGGNLGAGAAAGAANEKLIPLMADYLESHGVPQFVQDKVGHTIKNPEFADMMKLGSTLVGAGVGALAGGNTQSAAVGAGVALNATENNYLKHAEATKLSALQARQMAGKCDRACSQEISQLKATDIQRNQDIAACDGVSSDHCTTVRNDVRQTAGEYIRANKTTFDYTYVAERSETVDLAQGTMTGVGMGKLNGAGSSIVDTGVSVSKGAYTLFNAVIMQDPQAQQQVRQGAGSAMDYISNLDNWPQLLGAMSPRERKNLAQAYERGDGTKVGQILGASVVKVLSNVTSGGIVGVIKKIDRVAELGTGVKVADSAKIVEGVSSENPLFRGGNSLDARLGVDVKAASDGLIHPMTTNGKPQGLSLNLNPEDPFIQKYGGAFSVDSVPEGLQVIQSGKPGHFVIAPSAPMSFERYQQLLNQVQLRNFNTLP